MLTTITREQARDIEKRYFRYCQELKMDNKDFIESYIKNKYNISSIVEFITRINELDITEELLRFKNKLQSRISNNDPKKVFLVYFAVKDFIRDKRLELLYEMRDIGITKCMNKYPHWRIKDTIMNTKWKYMKKSFSPYNPVIDKYVNIEYKNLKEASKESDTDIEYIKKNFGYDKRWAYISDYTQFLDCLPIQVSCPPMGNISFRYFDFPGNDFTFNNIKHLSEETGESEDKLKYYIDKDRELYGIYKIRSVSFEEQFRLYSPLIIDGEEYYDITYLLFPSNAMGLASLATKYSGLLCESTFCASMDDTVITNSII